jgi:signal peptidase
MARPEEGGEGESSDGEEQELSRKEFTLLLARDIAVAAILVGIVFGSMFAYTQVWPPVVVVESGSMQHSNSRSYLGVIDTGDFVLVQAVRSRSEVVTYLEGRVSGYETYSNYGDVIIFHPPRSPADTTPIIHRALLYVEYPSASGPGVDIPDLARFPVSEWSGLDWADRTTTQTVNLRTVTIQVRDWNSGSPRVMNQVINFTARIRSGTMIAGFLTKGDHNGAWDDGYSGGGTPPVPVSEILGKARGEWAWFGLITLTVSPKAGCCRNGWGDPTAPANSWASLTTSLVLIPVGIFLADYGFAYAERLWKAYRRKKRVDDEGPGTAEEELAPEPENPR